MRRSFIALARTSLVARTVQASTRPIVNVSQRAIHSYNPGLASRTVLKQQMTPMLGVMARSLFIQTASTPNPASLKFLPGKTVLDEEYGTGMDFTPGDTKLRNSPIAKKLLEIPGAERVFLGRDFISVTKSEESSWDRVKPQVFASIMDFYAEGLPAVSDMAIEPHDTMILDDDSEVVAMVKELLETRIRPAVQEDGGDIFFFGFNEGDGLVSLQMAGSCAGCPSSSVTLKNGVENMLMHYIPEVTGVIAVDETGEQVEV